MNVAASRLSRRIFLASTAAIALARPSFAATIKPDAKSALIVVDVQNCFVDGGTLPVKGGAQIVPVINKLAGSFDNIVVTQDWHTPGHASFASTHAGKKPFETTQMPYGTQVLWPDHCVQGSDDAALLKDLKLPTAQLIIRKGFHKDVDSYSAFLEADKKTATGLAGYLKERGLTRVFLAGLALDFCVRYSAEDARREGFAVVVIEDACRGIDVDGSIAATRASFAPLGITTVGADTIG